VPRPGADAGHVANIAKAHDDASGGAALRPDRCALRARPAGPRPQLYAYARALGLKDDTKKLKDATKEIYGGDEYMAKLAETSVNLQAEDA
jgi:hypothetical protein